MYSDATIRAAVTIPSTGVKPRFIGKGFSCFPLYLYQHREELTSVRRCASALVKAGTDPITVIRIWPRLEPNGALDNETAMSLNVAGV